MIGEIGRLRLDRVGVLHPQRILRDIGQHVAVQQHRALGDAGRAAGILQEGDVVAADLGRLEGLAGAVFSASLNLTWPGSDQSGTIFFTRRTTKLTSMPLRPSRSPIAATTTCLTGGFRDHRLQRRGEILQDDDRFGAGILELVLELARRVERIDVDHGVAGPQRAIIAMGYCSTLGIMIATRAPSRCPVDCR